MKRTVLVGLVILLLTVACGGSGTEPPTNVADLQSYHLAEVCKGTVIEVAAAYDASTPGLHRVVFFDQNDYNEDAYDLVFNLDQVDMPEDWTVAVDGDYSTIELVGCLQRTSETLADTCEYTSDDSDVVSMLEIYHAVYELRVISPKTGEVVGTEQIDAPLGECPSLAFFSDENEVEQRYGRPHTQLTSLIEPYVLP